MFVLPIKVVKKEGKLQSKHCQWHKDTVDIPLLSVEDPISLLIVTVKVKLTLHPALL